LPNKPTQKSKYPSRYSPGVFVTPAQYIIELVCEQIARKKNVELPIQFWKLPEWKVIWGGQCRIANQLLTKFSPGVIIRVVQERKLENIRPKWVHTLIEKEQKIFDAIQPDLENYQHVDRSAEVVLPKQNRKNNTIGKLMELDNNG
jgi:hypothetical protein